jgi:hypothetical protein
MRPISNANAEWINGRQAMLILGCAQSPLMRLAVIGEIRVKNDPGVTTRYHRGDVERIAAIRRAGSPQLAGA